MWSFPWEDQGAESWGSDLAFLWNLTSKVI